MSNPPLLVKSLITYAICLVLALFLGFLISGPLSVEMLVKFSLLAGLLGLPLILKWHYPLLLLSWNCTGVFFFLPGMPYFWMFTVMISVVIAMVQHALDRDKPFLNVPGVTLSLVLLTIVVLITAKMTGGIGFRSLGGNTYGGKHYMMLLFGILAYFAITSQRIPPNRAKLFTALFFIGLITGTIQDFYYVAPSWTHFLFWIFPGGNPLDSTIEIGTTRLGGAPNFGTAVCLTLLAIYGLRRILESPWRLVLFTTAFCLGMLGGYRSYVATLGGTFLLVYFLEGLHRTRWTPRLVLIAISLGVALVPFASKLPFTLQRSLSFLPLEWDPLAKHNADETTDWRFKMWGALWQEQVPKHLLLGKGYALSAEDFQTSTGAAALSTEQFDPTSGGLALAGDYHNGYLSVLLPFGIWGALAFGWFIVSGWKVLYRNFKYGDPELKTINTLLFAAFIRSVIMFWGAHLHVEMVNFAGLVGLSVALNHGVRQPVRVPFKRLSIVPFARRLPEPEPSATS